MYVCVYVFVCVCVCICEGERQTDRERNKVRVSERENLLSCTPKACSTKLTAYSHSVVPGGFGVRSYKTLDIAGTSIIALTIL